jgi:hypothetical protein
VIRRVPSLNSSLIVDVAIRSSRSTFTGFALSSAARPAAIVVEPSRCEP